MWSLGDVAGLDDMRGALWPVAPCDFARKTFDMIDHVEWLFLNATGDGITAL